MSGGSDEQEKNSEDRWPTSPKFFSDKVLSEFARQMREFPVQTKLPTDGHLFEHPTLDGDFESALFQIWEKGREAADKITQHHLGTPNERLDPIQRRELRRMVQDGNEAKELLFRANLRLVKLKAKKYLGSGLSFDDLFQEGCLGLEYALNQFDWRGGIKFSTHASKWIRWAITYGVPYKAGSVRLPVPAGDTLARLQKARSRLELMFGRPPTLRELAAEVEMLEDKVTEALRFAAEPLSLSEPLREDGDAELGDVVEDRSAESPFEVAATALLPEEIQRLLAPLDDSEREILKLRFGLDRGEPRTMEEVGELFNVSPERIRQIEARAMSKLRHPNKPDADQSEK